MKEFINIEKLSAGNYFLTILLDEKEVGTKKIVVAR